MGVSHWLLYRSFALKACLPFLVVIPFLAQHHYPCARYLALYILLYRHLWTQCTRCCEKETITSKQYDSDSDPIEEILLDVAGRLPENNPRGSLRLGVIASDVSERSNSSLRSLLLVDIPSVLD